MEQVTCVEYAAIVYTYKKVEDDKPIAPKVRFHLTFEGW